MKKYCLVSLGVISLLAVSCSSSPWPKIEKYSSSAQIKIEGGDGGVVKPEDVTITDTLNSMESKSLYNLQTLPSTGDVNILVIPVVIPGYETIDIDQDGKDDSTRVREDLQKAFFSHNDDGVFESVSDFYYRSSYGKLRLGGTVTDYFSIENDSDLKFDTAANIGLNETYSVVKAAVQWAKDSEGIDLTEYDNDKDGYIDGVWCIYTAPDYQNGGPNSSDSGNNFWAYTSWGNQTPGSTSVNGGESPDVEDPVYNLFGWASYDFMYENYALKKVDTHTYIHETGHFLGLNDYYSEDSRYSPIGKVDMQDGNIIDHNSYSKMLLGWTKPYIAYGQAEIKINTMEDENSFIVIPSDSAERSNSFNPFSEYILIELYTNEGLNYQDSQQQIKDRPLAMNDKGVRIYHIDNRPMIYDKSQKKATFYQAGDVVDAEHRLIFPITNSRSSNTNNTSLGVDTSINLFDEIRLIEPKGKDTFSYGGKQSSKTLFKSGKTFSLSEFGNFFVSGKLNSGESLSERVTIEEVK